MKLAVIGTGKIAKEALFAMSRIRKIEIAAIFARPHSIETAEQLADQYQIKEIYTDYTKLLEKTEADTVYIGLVNSVHYSYAKEALMHDKNVILEKPFVLSAREAEELRTLAEERNLILVEAITVLHNDVFEKMKENLPKMGTLRMVQANYSQYSSRYDAYLKGSVAPAFDPDLQGGAVYDLDVYNIHYCVGLFGMPEQVTYFANKGFNGVDTSGTLVMQYPGFLCVCTAAKDSDSPCFVQVQGEKGWMRIDGKPNAAKKLTTVTVDDTIHELVTDASGAKVRATLKEEYEAPGTLHRMTKEFEDFADLIDTGNTEKAGKLLEETIGVVKVLEAVHQQMQ